MKPLVSILIPCYNAENWLVQTLESALNQTWKNIEIILVDDGSTDNSLAIAKRFDSHYVKVISQTNQGASAARNRAFSESQGDFIQYLDADDLLAADKIERQIHLLSSTASDFIASGEWGRFYICPNDATFTPEAVWQDMSPVDWLISSWQGGGMMHPAAWLIPRVIAQKAGPWNEDLSLNDDGEYFCRAILVSKGVKFCHGAKVYYRSGLAGSLSSLTSIAARKSEYESLKLCTEYLLAVENSPRTRRVCANVFQNFVYSTYPDAPDLVQKAQVNVRSLGGYDLKPKGSTIFNFLSSIVGWKLAKQMQKIISR
ncbi:glycosyltransferase family 2 protein [Calothrix sp. NIES-3974]|uniref:glycosyltransferase family 2 protein n=1 Tax=Calothrix sp. NIES-3974 TaxID=2005462 RepID=UPI000B5DE7C5|nr:glycosyltransferase [Calothrix sp. NIES-3974]BAZ03596.1 putative glycosyl transferase [Calothrix sp. NIES-3974]